MNYPSFITQIGALLDADTTKTIVAYVILALPLLSLPFILKMVGGLSERFGLWMNNRQRGLIDRSRNKGQELYKRGAWARGREDRRTAREARRQRNYADDIDTGKGIRGRYRRLMAGGVPITKGQREDRREAFRVASEQKRGDAHSRVKRRNEELGATDFHSHGTKVYKEGDDVGMDGERTNGKELSMDERLAAMASGENLVYFDAHGRRRVVDTKKDSYYKYAAMMRIGETGDKKATAAAFMNQYLIDQIAADTTLSDDEKRDKIEATITELGGDVQAWKRGEKAFKYTVTNKADKAEFMQFLNSSQGLAASHPHFRKSERGAFNNANAAQVASYSQDETMRGFDFHEEQVRTAQGVLAEARTSLNNAEATGTRADIDAAQLKVKDAQNSLKGRQEASLRFQNAFVDAIRNPNYQGTMDAGSIKIFTKRTGIRSQDIREGRVTAVAQAQPQNTPGQGQGQTVTVNAQAQGQPQTQPVTVSVRATANDGRYTVGYSVEDLQQVGPQGINLLVQNADGNVSNLGDPDVEKIYAATANYSDNQVDDVIRQVREQYSSRNLAPQPSRREAAQQRLDEAAQGTASSSQPFVASTTSVIGTPAEAAAQRREQRAAAATAAATPTTSGNTPFAFTAEGTQRTAASEQGAPVVDEGGYQSPAGMSEEDRERMRERFGG